ncbi:MAG: replication endonuclease, partial [Steroidobacteraceae bacterium]
MRYARDYCWTGVGGRGLHTAAQLLEREHARLREPALAPLPVPVVRFMRERAAALDRDSLRHGTAYIVVNSAELMAGKTARAFDESAIRDYAQNYCRRALELQSLDKRVAFARRCGIDVQFSRTSTLQGRQHRLCDSLWWRRQLRKAWTRRAENAMREVGMVRRIVAPYASDVAVAHHAARLVRQTHWLRNCEAVNTDTGEALGLEDLAAGSVANPAIRRGELMVRARGFEELAAFHKHVGLFVTLTVPSRFHAELMYGGKNPAHQRETVRAAQQWLCRMWARARAKFKRLSILLYGIRVAEPHHDGTPHWHGLLFVRSDQAKAVRLILSALWLSDGGEEAGAREHRCKFETIDSTKGSAAGYLAKYVAKNIDGAGQIGSAIDEETGGSVDSSVNRVSAWASVHGIRQFQQIGGPAVTLYRELRRLREPQADADIERARLAADRGGYRDFVMAVGGIAAGRRANVRVEREGERRAPFA